MWNINNTSFKLDGETVEIIYSLDNCDGSFFAWKNISEGISINIDPDFNEEDTKYKKTLEKIVENKKLIPSEQIVKNLITDEVIIKYLLNAQVDETIVIKFSKEWLKKAMNENA